MFPALRPTSQENEALLALGRSTMFRFVLNITTLHTSRVNQYYIIKTMVMNPSPRKVIHLKPCWKRWGLINSLFCFHKHLPWYGHFTASSLEHSFLDKYNFFFLSYYSRCWTKVKVFSSWHAWLSHFFSEADIPSFSIIQLFVYVHLMMIWAFCTQRINMVLLSFLCLLYPGKIWCLQLPCLAFFFLLKL